jgi:hypothetical protein
VPYFKYVGFQRLESLRRGRIRFTQPGAFNDPFEMPSFKAKEVRRLLFPEAAAELMRYMTAVPQIGSTGTATASPSDPMRGLSSASASPSSDRLVHLSSAASAAASTDLLQALSAASTLPKAVPLEAAIQRLEAVDQQYGILSLTLTPDNLLMWAHYADEHRGAVIEIDPTVRAFARPGELAGAVHYSGERPLIPETDDILLSHFFTKSREWAYETEYRVVRKLETCVAAVDAKPLPIHLFEFPPAALRRVVFGVRVGADQRAAAMAGLRGDRGFAHVTFGEAVLDPQRFRLEIRDLAP